MICVINGFWMDGLLLLYCTQGYNFSIDRKWIKMNLFNCIKRINILIKQWAGWVYKKNYIEILNIIKHKYLY